MNNTRHYLSERTRPGVAVAFAAAALLLAAPTWHGLAAEATGDRCATAGCTAATSTPSRAAIAGGRDSYADVVKVVAPAVVTVRVEGQGQDVADRSSAAATTVQQTCSAGSSATSPASAANAAGPRASARRASAASAPAWSSASDGYILTNNHVIDGADDIRVEFTDGRTLQAKLVGSDKPSDLALLKIDGVEPAGRSRSATPTRCRWATSSSRSAIRSASARR